jgi:hypothetical protein
MRARSAVNRPTLLAESTTDAVAFFGLVRARFSIAARSTASVARANTSLRRCDNENKTMQKLAPIAIATPRGALLRATTAPTSIDAAITIKRWR